MQRRFLTLLTGLLLLQSCAALVAEEWSFDDVGRIVAIADVHGAFDAMAQTLRNGSVIDDNNRWIAGDTHLVIVGDLLDRGPDSRKVMDLLIALEQQAVEAGGKVHVLLGNHEVMNLVGDLRYVAVEEYAAFAAEETTSERARAFAAWRDLRAGEGSDAELRSSFDTAFPPGYFAHRRAFSPDGRYGRWLLQKPILVVVNDTAFVHGGLSPLIKTLGLDGVNGGLMNDVREYVQQLKVLERAGVLLPTDSFYDHETLLANYLPTPNTSAEVLEAVEAVTRLGRSDVHALDGPLWYRGNVACNRLVEQDRLTETLASISAKRVVIGHTPTPTRQALRRFDGRVIEIDTGMLNNYYQGRGHALVIIGDALGVVSESSSEIQPLYDHQRLVGMRPGVSLSADDLERVLETGEITDIREDEVNRRIVTVTSGDARIDAVFDKRAARGFFPDVAAYRLDRILGLDAVPVTVRRKVDGDDGSLQFLPANAVDEPARAQSGHGGSASCPLGVQWTAMYVFDALIYNEGRSQSRMIYSPDDWRLMLIGHNRTFSTDTGVPRYLQSISLAIGDTWRSAMSLLTEELLEERFDGILDKRRRRALLARRDNLLKTAAETAE